MHIAYECQVFDRFPIILAELSLSLLKPASSCRENMTGFLLRIKRA